MSYSNEKPMSKDDLQMLKALVESPVFGVLRRLIEIQRGQLFAQMLEASDVSNLSKLQGQVMGLNLVQNLPVMCRDQFDKIVAKEAIDKKASSRSRRS